MQSSAFAEEPSTSSELTEPTVSAAEPAPNLGYEAGYEDGAAAAKEEASLMLPAAAGCCIAGGGMFLGCGCAGAAGLNPLVLGTIIPIAAGAGTVAAVVKTTEEPELPTDADFDPDYLDGYLEGYQSVAGRRRGLAAGAGAGAGVVVLTGVLVVVLAGAILSI